MPSMKYKERTYAGASFPCLEVTKAEYEALSEEKKMDGTVYMVTDGTGGWEAENSSYDNTDSGLSATNVQDALDELADEKYEKPSGGIPASDLASAVQTSLSKINVKTLENGQDLNNFYDNGFYYIATNVTNSPQDWSWLLVIGGIGTIQVCFTVSKIFVRAYTGSPIAWTSWRYVGLNNAI